MTSTLWTELKPGQISTNIHYDESTITYDSSTTQYGGVYKAVWVVQDGGQ